MEVGGEVRLIDFEYGFFAHSAHDIGNHFLEWTINYEFPEPPLYEIRHEDYPSEAQQRRFVRSYLTARGEGAVSDAAVEAFVAESKLFTMASHFMWACWGLVQVRVPASPGSRCRPSSCCCPRFLCRRRCCRRPSRLMVWVRPPAGGAVGDRLWVPAVRHRPFRRVHVPQEAPPMKPERIVNRLIAQPFHPLP